MSNSLVECIPNFAEARRPQVVEAIIQALVSVNSVTLLDRHSDNDHNRTVLTFLAPPEAAVEAAFRAIRKAGELINLDEHTGSHPRLGATDVVPFVPISGISMEECVQLARRLGERVGKELNIPVYLYEEAATKPERVNLENVRRGQYEALKAEMGVNSERKPDFGPESVGPAGGTIIGARHPLIAYNIYLDTDDLAIAKAIAKKVRASSGGLPCVKALGMLVEGRAQVSMNLTNFRQTSIQVVTEAVRQEAGALGTRIHHSELVGLIPQEALNDTAVRALQLQDFQADQILEKRVAERPTVEEPDFLEALAAATPTPGGGAAAAQTGAMGAALVEMVARLTIGKKKYAAVEAQMNEILNQAQQLRSALTAAAAEDSAAFEAVMAAFKLPRENPEQETKRMAAIETATIKAAQVPLVTAQKALNMMALAERCATLGNANAISDAASAVALGRAALTSAGYNVRINISGLQDRNSGDLLLAQLNSIEERAAKVEADLRKVLKAHGNILPA
jgi:glutamate formiminotransferase / formiminotetrahydrofolate cyclodeaminase